MIILNKIPQARTADLVVQPLADETLIYDTTCEHAILLNPTASQLWNACDGSSTLTQLAETLPGDLDPVLKQEIAALGLSQLAKHNLLSEPLSGSTTKAHITRRRLLKLGVAAALIPVVASLVVPTAAEAATGAGNSGSIGI